MENNQKHHLVKMFKSFTKFVLGSVDDENHADENLDESFESVFDSSVKESQQIETETSGNDETMDGKIYLLN